MSGVEPYWNPRSLKEYFEAILREREKHFDDQIAAADRAVTKAEQALDRRLEAMNELRDALDTAQKTFVTRNELATLQEQVNRRFDEMLDPETGIYARVAGSSNQLRSWAIALLTAILLLLLGLIAHIASTGGKFL